MRLNIETNSNEGFLGRHTDYNVSFQNVSFAEMKTLMTIFEGLEEERKREVAHNEKGK